MKAQKKYKRWQIDKSKNEESASFDKHESNDRYIPLFLLFSQTESNRLSNLGERTRSLTYLVNIIKKKSW